MNQSIAVTIIIKTSLFLAIFLVGSSYAMGYESLPRELDNEIMQYLLDYSITKEHKHDGSVLAVAWSPNGELLASGGFDNKVTVRSIKDDSIKEHKHDDWVRAVAWSSNGELLASGGNDNKVTVRSIKDGSIIKEYKHDDSVRAVAWSPNGELLASGSDDNKVIVRSIKDGSIIKEYMHDGWVRAVAWSPSGELLASGSDDGKVIVRSIKDGSIIKEYKHDTWVRAVAWSPNGELLVSGSDNKVIVCDIFTTLLNKKKKAAIKNLRHYLMVRTLEDMTLDRFYLNERGYQTWQGLTIENEATKQQEHIYTDEFELSAYQAKKEYKDASDVPVYKLVRKVSAQNNAE